METSPWTRTSTDERVAPILLFTQSLGEISKSLLLNGKVSEMTFTEMFFDVSLNVQSGASNPFTL